ncbi:MAG: UDP-N-acetylmuramoyl-L-alanyl-D-glutamate--2,6-diaminopimelate ligase [Lachnospiraceae bacterium]|nr:UDP-N-acetylmuramoyl-L-alanyl-D-glutamate--2,6-diaminopimelate ligase [Lachnospiraceae bacterium]
MKRLKDLLQKLTYTCVCGSVEEAVTDIVYDSRKETIEEGSVFVALSGATFDAHDYIPQVLEKGVKLLVVEKDIPRYEGVTVIRVENTRYALALMSAALFDYPARRLTMIGITGTKGKTTTAFMLRALLEKAGYQTGIVGTIGAFYRQAGKDIKIETKNTTPESYELHRIFRRMLDNGCTHVVMEVSSQAFMTHRVAGITFKYGIFTNLSPDHIGAGEHKDFAEYLYYKSQIFKNSEIGIGNADDEHFAAVSEGHTCKSLYTFGCREGVDLRTENVSCLREPGFIGIDCRMSGAYDMEVKIGCMGRFNAYNAMAAMLTAALLGISAETVKEVMYTIAVRGRVEPVHISDHVQLLIDYAPNAVSAESLLTTILEYKPKRLVCVFGAGGNRSKLRRYDMGEIAGKYADLSILTADNPRFEEVEDIIADIKIGMEKSHGNYIEIPDRREAIRYSIEHAEDGDIIALFGKGHEDYQEIKGVRYPFDERDVIAEILKSR